MPALGPSRRSSAVIKPVNAVIAGKPQVMGLEMALAFCTRICGSTSTAKIASLICSLPFFLLELLAGKLAPVQILRVAHGQWVTELPVQPIGKIACHTFRGVLRVHVG